MLPAGTDNLTLPSLLPVLTIVHEAPKYSANVSPPSGIVKVTSLLLVTVCIAPISDKANEKFPALTAIGVNGEVSFAWLIFV